ncbi:uncharacterized protein SCHCODRAFT_02516763 [Schizophyllum commune H4-8]|nr:uncharacterized protein SCHCODRAFT_02516763 [Schizophyllum commune H4-8]KAI5887067.1 hypothetical protein SCHCODRAFT_02516763 [Schizophyllum commune H4-8]
MQPFASIRNLYKRSKAAIKRCFRRSTKDFDASAEEASIRGAAPASEADSEHEDASIHSIRTRGRAEVRAVAGGSTATSGRICADFNTGTCGNGDRCRKAHECSVCRGKHSARSCPNKVTPEVKKKKWC